MLNRIWGGLLLVGILTALGRAALDGTAEPMKAVIDSTFDMAELGFEIALGLTGVMTLWLGFMRVGEDGGAVRLLSRLVAPLFRRLFPGIPEGHPATGSIIMNMAANGLGLDNAATPFGLKAMRELQSLNDEPESATKEQILFLVLNTSAVTVIPVTIFTYRAQAGAADPTDVFIPLLIATFASSLTGLIAASFVLRLHLRDPVVLAWIGGATAVVASLVWFFTGMDQDRIAAISAAMAHGTILGFLLLFLGLAIRRGVPLYESFIEGAKDGFKTAVMIIPYLVAMLVAIGIFRASGAMEAMLGAITAGVSQLGIDTRWIEGLPTALMRPLSGSGARGMMIETMARAGPDSFAGRLVSVIQGSTETTFYVLAVYFGAVGIKRPRQAVALGLSADLGGFLAAIFVCYLFFG